jgi:hypothetical protein
MKVKLAGDRVRVFSFIERLPDRPIRIYSVKIANPRST